MTLVLNDITLTYPDGDQRLTALDHVDLTVERGALTAVVGPSGSGKSSLLAVAGTLIRPDSGTVTVAGREVTRLPAGELAQIRREHIGLVFQQPNLLASLTAREQLELKGRLIGRPARDVRAEADELLESVGLTAQAGRRPHELSGGQRQRINIARALVNSPEVLLVDEPTSALDHERGAAILDLLASLTRERETSTILVTHDRSHLGVADQVVEVVDGRARSLASAAS